ncbi:U-box domain-containing protein 39-like [Salvia miltiorrhiza]|uniref:U-box domain-containing protein 39-like n=1 Tax=Salvia miltiorrhiza TaxID=226208 RepID=UPI0025ABD7F6|nr:U-box domain-containing protein 39-like [Salvia miltiorrhiza]
MMANRVRETIVECMRVAQSSGGDEEDRCEALQTLATITKISPQNRNLVAQVDGAVASLLALSKSPQHRLQALALSVLFNLSLNPNFKHSLAQRDTIFHLTSLIHSPESAKLAASFLCSLAMLDKNKAKFGVAGTVEVLVKAVSGPCGPATHHLLSSLAELVQFHGNCTLAVRAGAVPAVMTLAESGDGEELAGIALAILGLLARFEEGLSELKRTERIVARMVVILKSGCFLSKEGAAEILLRLFDDSEKLLRDAAELPEFFSVLAEISVGGSGRAREKANLLMRKLTDANLY